jgi:signal transduction histidine kinase
MLRRLLRRAQASVAALTGSLAGRLVIGATIVIIIGLSAGAVALPTLYRNAVERRFDTELRDQAFALVGKINEDGEGGLTLTDEMVERDYGSHLSGWYWQITETDGTVVLASESLTGYFIAPELPSERSGEGHFYDRPGPRDQKLRVVSRVLGLGSPAKDFVFTVGADRVELEADIGLFARTTAGALAALGIVLVGTVFLQVRFGLRPLRRIPYALAAIRSGQTERLSGSFSAEVEPLAREINALLDHNAQVVERARTQVGNLAHALKTPLAVLANESLRDQGELSAAVRQQTELMRLQVEHYLSRARMAARAGVIGTRTEVMPVLDALVRTLEKIYRARSIAIAAHAADAVAFRGERQDLEEMLGNLMDNACKWARARVEAEVSAVGEDRLRIEIADDGPGLPAAQRRDALKRGIRLDETTPGSGLGLSIVTDIAEIYGGSIELGDSRLGGLAAVLILPRALGEVVEGERPSRARRAAAQRLRAG